ncbi:MAG: Gfo/Idh/MocA family oxidoreductase [Chloroflexota bacterium]|nr:Gfo/Idh/MocA family oxidoreductase [Chloroflexota bacterium]
MSKKYRVGIIGFAHMHINNVAALYARHPQVELVACADTVPDVPELREAPYTRGWNLKNALTNIGVPKAYDDYHEMLEKEQFDIVICCSENAKHPEVVEACAEAGVNVQVEKPMAASLSDALRMVRAVQAAGTTMIVNWPLTWSSAARKAKALIEEGVIGRVLEVKWRGGHTGPLGPGAAHAGVSEEAAPMTGIERGATWWHQTAAGGGAMLDYCCYGSMVSRWYIGEPAIAAVGLKGNLNSHWGDADDNGAMIVRFPGAMGLFEGSWTTWDHGVSPGPIVYGTTGTLVIERRDGMDIVRLERGHGQTTIYEPDPLPEGREEIASELIHHLDTGEPVHQTLEAAFNLEVMAILDAGVRSAASGKLETVDSTAWCIG